jgi:hypothetical protein
MPNQSAQISTNPGGQLNQAMVHFSYLQVLDFLSTMAFLVNGIQEANPLVRMALKLGTSPVGGLVFVKLLAILLGVYCWRMGRARLLAKMNVFFALVITWNLVALILGALLKT